MIKLATEEFDIDITKSFCIGDKTCDIKLGKDAGCKTILVKTGKGGSDRDHEVIPDFMAEDLYEAAKKIVRGEL
jgi:histidinol phosphatase-like enzyme